MEQSVSERLRKFLEVRKISQGELARRFGVTKQTVNGWCTGATLVGTKHLIEISNAWPDLDMDWFLTGRYSMFTDQGLPSQVNEKESEYQVKEIKTCVDCMVKDGIIRTLSESIERKDSKIEDLSKYIGELTPKSTSSYNKYKNGKTSSKT